MLNRKLLLIALSFSLFAHSSFVLSADVKCSLDSGQICTSHAKDMEGKTVEMCGLVAATKRFAKGYYINFDQKFPNQTITGVIWDDNLNNFQTQIGADISKIDGKALCMKGKIGSFQGRLQIVGYDKFKLQE
jgi:hypothetical protein